MPSGGHEIDERVVPRRHRAMHRLDDALVLLRPGDREHGRDSARVIFSGSAPMQPVTITRPFSLTALPMASSDSACALSRKPQVLTTTTSAPACARASS